MAICSLKVSVWPVATALGSDITGGARLDKTAPDCTSTQYWQFSYTPHCIVITNDSLATTINGEGYLEGIG